MSRGMIVTDLDLDTVKAGLANGSIVIVDVREPHEFAAGHIPGALSMPLSSFDPQALPRGRGRRIVFSCAAGVRSIHAIAMAQGAGLALNEHYRGGFREWISRGEPVES